MIEQDMKRGLTLVAMGFGFSLAVNRSGSLVPFMIGTALFFGSLFLYIEEALQ